MNYRSAVRFLACRVMVEKDTKKQHMKRQAVPKAAKKKSKGTNAGADDQYETKDENDKRQKSGDKKLNPKAHYSYQSVNKVSRSVRR